MSTRDFTIAAKHDLNIFSFDLNIFSTFSH